MLTEAIRTHGTPLPASATHAAVRLVAVIERVQAHEHALLDLSSGSPGRRTKSTHEARRHRRVLHLLRMCFRGVPYARVETTNATPIQSRRAPGERLLWDIAFGLIRSFAQRERAALLDHLIGWVAVGRGQGRGRGALRHVLPPERLPEWWGLDTVTLMWRNGLWDSTIVAAAEIANHADIVAAGRQPPAPFVITTEAEYLAALDRLHALADAIDAYERRTSRHGTIAWAENAAEAEAPADADAAAASTTTTTTTNSEDPTP